MEKLKLSNWLEIFTFNSHNNLLIVNLLIGLIQNLFFGELDNLLQSCISNS